MGEPHIIFNDKIEITKSYNCLNYWVPYFFHIFSGI